MSNRFHSKYHRSNHHTLSSANNLDSSHDPIASPDYPFKGSMVIDSSTDDLSLSALGNVTVQGNVSATAFYGDGTNITGVVATPASENLSADNIYSYTNFVSSIKFHNNLDMNGWSISGIADESISFESGVKISSSSDNLFKVQADRVNLGDISNNIVGGGNSSIAGGTGNALTGRFVHIGGGSSNEVEGNSGTVNYGTIGGGQSNKIDLNAINGFVGGGFTNTLSANYTSIVGGSTNKIHSGTHSFIGGGLRSTIISGPQSVIAGGRDNTVNSSLGWSSIAGGKDNTVEGDYGTVIGGLNNKANAHVSIAGGANTNVYGSNSIGLGYTNNIYSGASYAALLGGQNNIIDDGTHSFVGAGNTNALSGGCGTIGAGCYNTISADNCAIVGGLSNYITGGTTNFIGAGSRNYISDGTGSFIGAGSDNNIKESALASVIVGGSTNTLSGDYTSIAGGYQNTIKNTGGANYGTIAGGRTNIIDNATHATVLGGQTNIARGNNSIVGGTGAVTDGQYAISLGLQTSAHHDYSVVIGGTAAGTTVSEDTNTVKLSGTNGITLGENATVVGNISATKFVGDGSELTGISGGGGGISAVVDDTSPQLGGNLDLNSRNITGTGNIDVTGDFTLEDTATDSAAGPEITLYRNSASPADGDYLGQIKFQGENDAGQTVLYSKITGKTSDVTDTTEDGLIEYAVRKAGSNTIVSRLTHEALKLINGTGLEVNGNITTDGTVDGRDVAADGATLDSLNAQVDYGMITVNLDNGTSAITTGVSAWAEMPFNAVIERVTILADQVGALSGEIQKDSYGNWPPTAADSILSFGGTNINKYEDNSPPGGTSLNLSAGDVMQFVVLSADTITKAVVSLKVRKEL